MQEKVGRWNIQNIIVSVCFMAVCLATQQIQTKAWNSGLIDFSRDATGVLLAIVIMSNYKWSDFVKYKIPYIIWSVVGGGGLVIITPIAIKYRYEYLGASTIVIAVGIFLMGFCIIHTAINFFVEKYRPRLYKPLFALWTLMLIWMIFSETEYWWPEAYFVLFLCYYLTEQTPAQRRNVIGGMVNGIILGFMVIQGHSLLCRPYDRPKYFGNFCNPNHNCMFLCMCIVAILAKILLGVRKNQKKLWQIFLYLMAGACYSFIFMTGCRSGYLSSFVVTFFFLLGYCRVKRKRVFFQWGILLIALFVVMMPMTYLAVRYFPTIHPHVVFYFQEGYSEERVHSWDPRDSEKYVSFEEMMDYLLWRFSSFLDSVKGFEDAVDANEYGDMRIVSSTSYFPSTLLTANVSGFLKHKDPDKIPLLDDVEIGNQLLVRYTIYKWYYEHLTLRGMPYDEQGFQITSVNWNQDTHNIYLDYGINFGWPAMIMFAVFIWWGIGRLTVRGMKMRDPETLTCLLICLVPPIFGFFEYSWGPGMISTVAFYLSFKEMFNTENLNSDVQQVALPEEAKPLDVAPEKPIDDLEFIDI